MRAGSRKGRTEGGVVERLWQDGLPETICQLPELGLSCFGCCGYDWKPTPSIRRQVAYNTWRYKTFYTRKEVFAGTTEGVTRAGACRAVIEFEDGTVGCPLHPARNGGRDFRKGDCLTEYECNTLKHYKKWNDRTRRRFLELLSSKGYDTYEYSMANAKGTLLAGFKKSNGMSRLLFKDFLR